MKSLPWVTLCLTAAFVLPRHQAFGQRTPESARAEMELLELRQSLADVRSRLDDLSSKLAEALASQRELARQMESSLAHIREELGRQKQSGAGGAAKKPPGTSLFPRALEAGLDGGAASSVSAATRDQEVVEALRELVALLADCHKRVEAEFRSGYGPAQDFFRISYELNAARAELAWAEGDLPAALTALKQARTNADQEVKAWLAHEAQGLMVREGALDRRVEAAKRRGDAVRAIARVTRAMAEQEHAETVRGGKPLQHQPSPSIP